ncbi:MAG: TonB-dependent receptor [Alphaproteobacteria bacterium]|nr:TonB-dependent receptor [Alphaproteobacteria bacterium]
MFLFVFFLLIAFCKGGCADQTPTLPTLLVKAKREAADPLSINTITDKALQTNQQETVLDALKDLPGIHAVQQGGSGRSASMFIRGGDPGETLVLIDGMRGNDPSTPNGLFDFGHLSVDGIETIEVAKGPYAAQYGGDAMAGVVSIKTAKGKGKPTFKATAEAGSFETFQQGLGTQGQINAVDFNVNVSHFRTDGTPSTSIAHRTLPRQWNPEPYERNAFSSRLGAQLNPDWHLSLWNRYQHNCSRYVNETLSSNPSAQDIGAQWLNRAQLEGEVGSKWKPAFGIGYVEQERRSGNDIVPFMPKRTDQGQTFKLDWKNQIKVTDSYDVHLGVEKEQQSYRSDNHETTPVQARADEKDLFMGNILNPHKRVKLEAWGRYHRHSQFGGENSYRTAATYRHLETRTEIYTSYGTAIKAPSLSQLFDTKSGNPHLHPEKSHGYEVGVRQPLTQKVEIGTTFFRNLISELISSKQVAPLQFTYSNINNAETRGLESFISIKPVDGMTFRLEHTYLRAKNLNTDLQLSRRPLHKLAAQLNFQMTEVWDMGIGAIHNGKQVDDTPRFVTERVYMGGATVLRVYTTYHVNKNWDVFGRIENALNRHFEEPSGYLQPGLAVYGGIRIRT